MSLWGLLGQGIQDTLGHIMGFATGTHETQINKHNMQLAEQQLKLDQQNFQHTLDKFKYDKAIQQQMFEREDNAVQRRTADLRAAGINPLLAAGSPANAGAHVGVTAPMKQGTGLSMRMQANQMIQEQNFQRKAKSLQLSQMISHAELLHAQAEHEKAKTKETEAHTDQITGITQNQIDHLASSIDVNKATLSKIISETNHISLDNEIKHYNYSKARSIGARTDVNPTLVGELTQLFYIMSEYWNKNESKFKNAIEQLKIDWNNHPLIKSFEEAFNKNSEDSFIRGLLDALTPGGRRARTGAEPDPIPEHYPDIIKNNPGSNFLQRGTRN